MLCISLGVSSLACSFSHAADEWDASAGTHWWFNPANWSKDVLPPANDTLTPPTLTDTQINIGTGAWDQGFGVLYDPANDPGFAAAGGMTFPTDYGRQKIAQLYISRAANPPAVTAVPANKLTIRGDLESTGPVIVGRSSGIAGTATNGTIIHESGLFKVPNSNIDLGQAEAAPRAGFGNGIYDYRGGTVEVSQSGGSGLRLAAGGGGGVGGIGRFIMRNPGPTNPGYVRAFDVNVAANEGNTTILANGTTNGVGIVEFHVAGGNGTRPIQVNRNLIINNGGSGTIGAVRSSRLDLVLDAAPTVNGSGVPQDLGLFDVAFSDVLGTSTTGAGTLGDFFSSADGNTLYTQGATVSANFAGSTYNWTISYTGNITWAGTVGVDYGNSGQVVSISDTGGVDVVLKGLSSVIGPQGVPGDYNDNGVVDGADYVLWRNGGPLENEVDNPGTVNAADYTAWRVRFGNTSGSGAGLHAAGVPEPGTMVLVFAGLVGASLGRRRP